MMPYQVILCLVSRVLLVCIPMAFSTALIPLQLFILCLLLYMNMLWITTKSTWQYYNVHFTFYYLAFWFCAASHLWPVLYLVSIIFVGDLCYSLL